jgi:hypothetical protein
VVEQRFSGYTVPHTQVRRTLTVLADVDRLRIVDGQEIVATCSSAQS